MVMKTPVSFLDPSWISKKKEAEMLYHVHSLQAELPYIKGHSVAAFREIQEQQ